jgi:type II secretory pathway component PulF
MPSFQYRARDHVGNAITGVLDGSDSETVAEQILRVGYIPVDFRPKQKEVKVNKGTAANWADRWMRRVGSNGLIDLNRQLALVLGAGVPLSTCHRLMAKRTDNDRPGDIQLAKSDDIEVGGRPPLFICFCLATELQPAQSSLNPLKRCLSEAQQ